MWNLSSMKTHETPLAYSENKRSFYLEIGIIRDVIDTEVRKMLSRYLWPMFDVTGRDNCFQVWRAKYLLKEELESSQDEGNEIS